MAFSTRLVPSGSEAQHIGIVAIAHSPALRSESVSEIHLGSISERRVFLKVPMSIHPARPPAPTVRSALSAIRIWSLDKLRESLSSRRRTRTSRDKNTAFRNQSHRDLGTGALARSAGLWTVGYAATLDDPRCATVHQAERWSPEVLREPLRRSLELRGARSRRSPERAPGFIALPAKVLEIVRRRPDSSTLL